MGEDLRSPAFFKRKLLSLFEGYKKPLLPVSDGMKAGEIYLSVSFVFAYCLSLSLIFFFTLYFHQKFPMKIISLGCGLLKLYYLRM